MQHDSDMSYTELDAVSSARVLVTEGLVFVLWLGIAIAAWVMLPA